MKKTKKIIEMEKGNFTVIPYNVLRDKRLSSTDKILLIEILSDTEDFAVSAKLYCERLSIVKRQFYRSLNNLIELGYVSKKALPSNSIKEITYFYTISSYGNLKEETVEISNISDSKEEIIVEDKKEEILQPKQNLELIIESKDELIKYLKNMNITKERQDDIDLYIEFINKGKITNKKELLEYI
jgi:predicted transcriptional regulator